VGFRVMSLVTTNDTDPVERAKDEGADGSGSFGVLWRVNGEAIWSKGANMIPMDNFEGASELNNPFSLTNSCDENDGLPRQARDKRTRETRPKDMTGRVSASFCYRALLC